MRRPSSFSSSFSSSSSSSSSSSLLVSRNLQERFVNCRRIGSAEAVQHIAARARALARRSVKLRALMVV
eukprot:1010526-Pyramimonas_sp.AAC.1